MRPFGVLLLATIYSTIRADFHAPLYTLDLDLPPQQRWRNIMEDQVDLHGGYEYSFKSVVDFTQTILPLATWTKYDEALTLAARRAVGSEQEAEIDGIMAVAKQRKMPVLKSQAKPYKLHAKYFVHALGLTTHVAIRRS